MTFVFYKACAFSFILTHAFAQLQCDGTLSSKRLLKTSVVVNGGTCTISDITISSSVHVMNGGMLKTSGDVTITGSLTAKKSGSITLGGNLNVKGDFTIEDTTATSIVGASVSLNNLKANNGPNILLKGKTGSISARNAGFIHILGGKVSGGGILVESGQGALKSCDATIIGGISVVNSRGGVMISPGAGCSRSEVRGAISVQKSTGDVVIGGSQFDTADLLVTSNKGMVTVKNAGLSDVNIQSTEGNVVLDGINTDSDSSVTFTSGLVTLKNSNIKGDFKVKEASSVMINKNHFSLEDLSISDIRNSVSFTNNNKFSASFTGNSGGVIFSNNEATVVLISKNKGQVSIKDNLIDSLSCSDNLPYPSGSGNSIFKLADNQCSKF